MKSGFYISLIIDDEEFYKCAEEIRKNKYYDSVEFFYPEDEEIRKNHLKRLEYVKNNLNHIKEYTMHLPFMVTNIASKDKNKLKYSMELMKEAIYFAYQNKVDKLTLHLGLMEDNNGYEECLKRNIKSVKKLLKLTKKYQMTLCVENLCQESSITRTKEEMKKFFNYFKKSDLKMTLDIGHYAVINESFDEYIEEFKDVISHIHIHDNHLTSDEHLNLGEGIIDLKGILKKLKEVNYNGVLLVETGYKKSDYVNNYLYLKNENVF